MASAAEGKSLLRSDRSRGRHRRARPSVFSSLGRFRDESFFRNSVFLIINLALGAGCGYGGLFLLTRLYSVQAVGLSAAAASASALIVFVMQFGINFSLPRFLPTSPNRAALINTVLTVTILATFLGAIAYLILPVAGKLYALGGWLFVMVFVIGACLQAGESAFETILVADKVFEQASRRQRLPKSNKASSTRGLCVCRRPEATFPAWWPLELDSLFSASCSREEATVLGPL